MDGRTEGRRAYLEGRTEEMEKQRQFKTVQTSQGVKLDGWLSTFTFLTGEREE
jgi:hypothetical protein